jgi:hypothetical protein
MAKEFKDLISSILFGYARFAFLPRDSSDRNQRDHETKNSTVAIGPPRNEGEQIKLGIKLVTNRWFMPIRTLPI